MAEVGYSSLQALIVDDFDSFRLTVSKMLQDLGIRSVDTAVNGAEALRACKLKPYDLVLCDYNLGKGKTGQQVLEDLRYHKILDSTALFILVSAESSKSIVMAAYDHEPDAYLTKPITTKSLHQRLTRLLAQREVMGSIYRAMDRGRTSTAIALCRKQIAAGSRYTSQCQKALGQLYLDSGDFQAAEAVYQEVLEQRQLDWAQVGMARAKKAQGDVLSARQWLEEVIHANPMCLRAYDIQAEICREQGDNKGLQAVLQQVVEISPLAILRQQQLADVASENGDAATAVDAYRRSVRLGEHSCYDRLESHIGFGRATSDLHSENPELAKPYAREAAKVMGGIEQRFGKGGEYRLQALLIESQLSAVQGDKNRAHGLLEKVRDVLREGDQETDLVLDMEMLKALRKLDLRDDLKQHVTHLLEKYQGQEGELERLDHLLEEPASEKNRTYISATNKRGIAAYESGDFASAINCFTDALRAFPNHIGLRLNLVQALLDKLEQQDEDSASARELAIHTLEFVGQRIPAEHGQFARYRQLSGKLQSIENRGG